MAGAGRARSGGCLISRDLGRSGGTARASQHRDAWVPMPAAARLHYEQCGSQNLPRNCAACGLLDTPNQSHKAAEPRPRGPSRSPATRSGPNLVHGKDPSPATNPEATSKGVNCTFQAPNHSLPEAEGPMAVTLTSGTESWGLSATSAKMYVCIRVCVCVYTTHTSHSIPASIRECQELTHL